MSYLGKWAIKKHLSLIQSSAGLSICCIVFSSCGSGLPTSNPQASGGGSGSGGGQPAMKLQVDKWNNNTWEDVTDTAPYILSCRGANSDYTFRLANSGSGRLNAAGTVVSISKTSDYAGGTMNGAPGDYTFTAHTQPTMPVQASSVSDFTIRLANSNGDCMLGGRGHNHEGMETALVTISTDDPTNPTFNATIRVWGSS